MKAQRRLQIRWCWGNLIQQVPTDQLSSTLFYSPFFCFVFVLFCCLFLFFVCLFVCLFVSSPRLTSHLSSSRKARATHSFFIAIFSPCINPRCQEKRCGKMGGWEGWAGGEPNNSNGPMAKSNGKNHTGGVRPGGKFVHHWWGYVGLALLGRGTGRVPPGTRRRDK